MIVTFDVETLACTDAEVIESLRATVKPPATHKKQETIDSWMAENAESALAEMVAKTSFDGMYGKIACIAWKFDDGEVCSSLDTDTEEQAINRFYDAVRCAVKVDYHGGSTNVPIQFCGHNIAGFDLPFLKHRSIILGIKPPPNLIAAMNAKPWDKCIADTMTMWSSDNQKRVSMDKLCKAFGIQGKDGFDGSMVNAEWTTGSKQRVIQYCRDDIDRTYAIYKRITFS